MAELVNKQGRHLQEAGRNDRDEDREVEVILERVQARSQVSEAHWQNLVKNRRGRK